MRAPLGPAGSAVVVVVLVFALGSCGTQPKSVDIPRVSQTPTTSLGGPSVYLPGQPLPDETPLPDDATPTSPGPPPAIGVAGAHGGATGKVNGEPVSVSFDRATAYPIYNPPSGVVNITWADSDGNVLVIGGTRMTGAPQKTGMNMGLNLTLQQPQMEVFNSGDGRCTVTFTTTAKNFVAGNFICEGMKGDKGSSIDVSGPFSARF